QEILNAITVIRALIEHRVLENGAQPNRARAQIADIPKPRLEARKLPALVLEAIRIVEGRVSGSSGDIVEPVHHQKVDPLIPPVCRRGKRRLRRSGRSVQYRLEI